LGGVAKAHEEEEEEEEEEKIKDLQRWSCPSSSAGQQRGCLIDAQIKPRVRGSMLKAGALLLATLLAAPLPATPALPANVAHPRPDAAVLLPKPFRVCGMGVGAHQQRGATQAGDAREGDAVRGLRPADLSPRELLELLRPVVGSDGGLQVGSWFEGSLRRRLCHACVVSGRGEREGTASFGIASDCGDLRWRALLCKDCVGGSRPVPAHLIPLVRRCRRCRRFATFGPPAGARSSASHCKEHKEPRDVVVTSAKCEHPDCTRRALFGQAASLVARTCASTAELLQPSSASKTRPVRRLALRCGPHRQPGDIEVYARFCTVAGCHRHATCGPMEPCSRRSVCAMHKPAPNNTTTAKFVDLSSVVRALPHALYPPLRQVEIGREKLLEQQE